MSYQILHRKESYLPARSSHESVVIESIDLDPQYTNAIYGITDANLKVLSNLLDVDIFARGNTVRVKGQAHDIARARNIFDELESIARRGHPISPDTIKQTLNMVTHTAPETVQEIMGADIIARRGKVVRPKTLGQKRYVDAIDNNTITFGIGPAGSGKTYLAVAKAVQALQAKQVSRIILTRPAVEAGEKLGFLPGTLGDKIDPYLRPLYDALRDMLDPDMIPKMMEMGIIEVAPLAYMRGRTLGDSFVILDEAQNTTQEQMKMFLTRLGFGTKMVVTGDVSQVDLPRGQQSGLRVVRNILEGVEGIEFCDLVSADVVRHQLVSRIVDAYDSHDAQKEGKTQP